MAERITMFDMGNFKEDLKRGSGGEQIFIGNFYGWTSIANTQEGIRDDKDARSIYYGATADAKYDEMSDRTGNFYLEEGNNNNPGRDYAGWFHPVKGSKADLLAIIKPGDKLIYVFSFRDLRRLAYQDGVIPHRQFFLHNSAFLLPINKLDDYGITYYKYSYADGKKKFFHYDFSLKKHVEA